jgi:hypothetical protein
MIFSENRFPLFRIMLLIEHDLRANASLSSRGKTGFRFARRGLAGPDQL